MRRALTAMTFAFVALLIAQRAAAQDGGKAWLDVNVGAASAAEPEYIVTQVVTISGEQGGGVVGYSNPGGGSFDIGGGYMLTPRLGVGVSIAGTAHEHTGELGISIPHPLYFNASATDTASTGGLKRGESSVHLQAMLTLLTTSKVRVRAFAGPSHIRAEQDVVTNIKFNQVFQIFGLGNTVDITSFEQETRTGSAWGFHAGGDVSVFFSPRVGVGGMVRVSRATVSITDYDGPEDRTVGGVQFGGGLRLKF